MNKNFYCHICQLYGNGIVKSVVSNKIHDIVILTCCTCKTDSTIYCDVNTVPKPTESNILDGYQ